MKAYQQINLATWYMVKLLKKNPLVARTVVHAWNPSTQETEQEDCEFEDSLGYIAKCWLKRKKEKKYSIF
jgi:hypothetical protein